MVAFSLKNSTNIYPWLELIGEEIYDEFDLSGPHAASKYIPPAALTGQEEERSRRRLDSGRPTRPVSPTVPVPSAPATHRMTQGIQFPKVHLFGRSRSQPGTPRTAPPAAATVEKRNEDQINDTLQLDSPSNDAKVTDGTLDVTLHPASTFDTESTLMPEGSVVTGSGSEGTATLGTLPTFEDRERKPSAMSFAERGRVRSTPGTPRGHSPSTRGGVTEAILQTQTRRRAAHMHSASSLGLNSVAADTSHPPVTRQVTSRGRFKSSPLTPVTSLAPVPSHDEDSDKDKDRDKVGDIQGKGDNAAGIIAWNEHTQYDEQDDDFDGGYDSEEDRIGGPDPYLEEPKHGL